MHSYHPWGVCTLTYVGSEREPRGRSGLGAIASALATRTTSVATEEAICIAVLLDLDVEEIAQTTPSIRMQRLWSMLPGCPRQLLFGHLPTHDIHGLHWAPLSFLMQPLTITPTAAVISHKEGLCEKHFGTTAIRYEDGILVQAPGIRAVVGSPAPLGRSFYVRMAGGLWYLLKRLPEIDTRPQNLIWGRTEVAFIDSDEWREAFAKSMNPARVFQGMVVRIDRNPELEEDGIIRCTRLFRAIAILATNPILHANLEAYIGPSEAGRGVGHRDPDNGEITSVAGERVPGEQTWCIR